MHLFVLNHCSKLLHIINGQLMFEMFRHLYWEAGKPTVAAESHFQWERGDAGELEDQVGRIAIVKNCWTIPRCGPNSEYPVLGSDTSMSGFELHLIWFQLFPLGLKEEASALIGSPQDQRKEHLSRWNPLTNQLKRKRSRKKSRNQKKQQSE